MRPFLFRVLAGVFENFLRLASGLGHAVLPLLIQFHDGLLAFLIDLCFQSAYFLLIGCFLRLRFLEPSCGFLIHVPVILFPLFHKGEDRLI